jgi:hypothetical protein
LCCLSFFFFVLKGSEALNDFIESRRIYEDLTLALLEKEFRMNIVFREWDDDLIPEREIRCFVVNGKVTAMTQYYSSLFVEFLAENKNDLQQVEKKKMIVFFKLTKKKRILDYLGKVVPVVRLDSFTIDVGMRKDLSLCVVEINPPAPRSGCSLFQV